MPPLTLSGVGRHLDGMHLTPPTPGSDMPDSWESDQGDETHVGLRIVGGIVMTAACAASAIWAATLATTRYPRSLVFITGLAGSPLVGTVTVIRIFSVLRNRGH